MQKSARGVARAVEDVFHKVYHNLKKLVRAFRVVSGSKTDRWSNRLSKKILVTGSAGFIGSALSIRLLERGDQVIGIDNHNDYYDPALKEARLARHADHPNYTHIRMNLEDREGIANLFKEQQFQGVVNLAAQAGVRYSLENPLAYIDTNLVGFGHILEGCRHNKVEHMVYASSSSVYGSNTKMPFSVHDNVNHPVSLLRRHQKSQRTDGSHLQPSLQPTYHRTTLLHRLWSVGSPRHGTTKIHQSHPRRRKNPNLQLRKTS